MGTLQRLGHTDLELSTIGLGCWQFSNGEGLLGRYWKRLDLPVVRSIVDASVDAGVNWFDTAEAYGRGASEHVLAGVLSTSPPRQDRLHVADKWWPTLRRATDIQASFDERLEHLAPLGIDLYQIHNPFSLSTVHAQMEAMADLAEAGKIGAIGVSNFSARRMRAAARALSRRGMPLASNQVRYSLLDRRIESNGVLEAARETGVSIIAYSPLAQGLLSGKFHRHPETTKRLSGPRRMLPAFRPRGLARTRPLINELTAVASTHGATPAQVALAWILQFHQGLVFAIPGATSLSQARDNAAAMELELAPGELSRLDRLSRALA